ncbi:MAG TPA: cytochrome c oxidase assembly factor Coa1 family protein [Rhizomicrobium sp.]
MTETMPSPPEKTHHGFLWGCLGAFAIVVLVVIGTVGYGSWLVYHSMTSDPGLRMAMNTLEKNGLAAQVLGRDIHVVSVDGGSETSVSGERGVYILHLKGSKGEGIATVNADLSYTGVHVTAMILTGPDGTHYDLLRHTITPPKNSI